jgi:hypothetical protein
MRGQVQYVPTTERERRARLEREADAILRANRERQPRKKKAATSLSSATVSEMKWVPLSDLKRVLRRKEPASRS